MLNNDEIQKIVNSYNKKANYPVDINDFIYNAERYIKAIKEGRMLCKIASVSASGMSRNICFNEMNKSDNQYYIYNFYLFFCVLGYSKVKDTDYFRINGCGMDMIFHTNYSIIHQLHDLGFVDKADCTVLAQKTPHII